jgi:hypothetical protein
MSIKTKIFNICKMDINQDKNQLTLKANNFVLQIDELNFNVNIDSLSKLNMIKISGGSLYCIETNDIKKNSVENYLIEIITYLCNQISGSNSNVIEAEPFLQRVLQNLKTFVGENYY